MQIRAKLVAAFLLVALIPLSLLSAIFTYSILQIREQISNIYLGAVEILSGVTEGSDALLDLRGNTIKHILASTPEEREEIEEEIRSDEQVLLQILLKYKKIEDFPIQIGILRERGLESLIPYENALLAETHANLAEFRVEKDRTLALSNQDSDQEALLHWSGPAGERLDRLRSNFQDLVDLNSRLAEIMYEESQSVAQEAFAMGLATAAISAVAATSAAIFFSKRLTPPLEEVEQKARREIEKFISGAPIPRHPSPAEDEGAAGEGATPSKEVSADLKDWGRVVLLQSTGYRQDSDKVKAESAQTLESIMEKSLLQEPETKLVVMTRKGSNLYYKAHNTRATVYILSSSIQNPIETSEEGMLVISINQTSLILEAIKRTLRENPSATFIIDSATELVHRLGFEKVFPLMQNISDLTSAFPKSRVIILINRHAHESNVVEALASLANNFVE